MGWGGPWNKIGDAVQTLADRRLRGKPVLDMD
ncbi:hypothetical protein M2161_009193 [Streptomyces sp. SAI-133]|nr:hypothetical protein [Streptomyces sp. SAI-133]